MSVLQLESAHPRGDENSPIEAPVDIRLDVGELAVVQPEDHAVARALTELCAGVPPLGAGRVLLFGEDVSKLPRTAAETLRGRIGLAAGEDGWLPHLPVEDSMLLPRQHHGATDLVALRLQAEGLARHFGLEGVPQISPHELSRLDLARIGCMRAFLGAPELLLLESPHDAEAADMLVEPLRACLDVALARGAAAVWVTRSHRVWGNPGFPAQQRWRLGRDGLQPL